MCWQGCITRKITRNTHILLVVTGNGVLALKKDLVVL